MNEHITLDYNKLYSLMNMKYEELLLKNRVRQTIWLVGVDFIRYCMLGQLYCTIGSDSQRVDLAGWARYCYAPDGW